MESAVGMVRNSRTVRSRGRQVVARSQVCQQLRVRVDWRAHGVVLEWHLRNESLTKQPVVEHGQPTEAPLTVRDEYACPVTELEW